MINYRYVGILVLLSLLQGCTDETLYSNLEEREANKIIMILRAAGMSPKKEEEKGIIRLKIPPKEFQSAMELLELEGLPRERNNAQVYLNSDEKSALISSAKYTDYINSEIEEAIYDMPNVVSVHVISFIPDSRLGEQGGEANVSIVIIYSDGLDTQNVLPKIEGFVSNAIPSLLPDNISVQFFIRS